GGCVELGEQQPLLPALILAAGDDLSVVFFHCGPPLNEVGRLTALIEYSTPPGWSPHEPCGRAAWHPQELPRRGRDARGGPGGARRHDPRAGRRERRR